MKGDLKSMAEQNETDARARRECEPAVCESCGGGFDCGASLAGCWCSRVELSEPLRAELRERFKRCLCRACLERFAAAEQTSKGAQAF